MHAAAPCPVPVKQQMIDWWGPVLLEYYAATEGVGFSACDSAEWLAHPGTVGKVAARRAARPATSPSSPSRRARPARCGSSPGRRSVYFDDPEKTAEPTSPDGSMVTVGDVGYLDDDGYLHLTDRATFMIISGGVNIYPQECENLLVTHPKVADAAVFGVPNEISARKSRPSSSPCRRRPGPGGRRRADRVLPRAPRPPQMPAYGRLHRRAPPAPDRQALQEAPPGRLLGPIPQPHRVTNPGAD